MSCIKWPYRDVQYYSITTNTQPGLTETPLSPFSERNGACPLPLSAPNRCRMMQIIPR